MPLNIQAVTIDKDDRLMSYCVTAHCTYADFLELTNAAEENLSIQRAIIRGSKAYATLRADLKRGCVLPPVVLAVKVDFSSPMETLANTGNLQQLSIDFSTVGAADVYVIDGLQRTNAIRQTCNELEGEEKTKFLARQIRLELWPNISFGAVAYRMLLLNAGQRPMSMKHQVEVLSSKLMDDLAGVPNLDIFRANDARRRVQPGQLALAKLALAFQAWLQGQPNVDIRNTVMEELLAESAIEILGKTAQGGTAEAPEEDGFRKFVSWLVKLDVALGVANISFLGSETVLLGIAAAIGALERNAITEPRVWPALNSLCLKVSQDPVGDALGIQDFERLKNGIDPSKVNVGAATRLMVFAAFKEYIRGSGETPMSDCWQIGASQI